MNKQWQHFEQNVAPYLRHVPAENFNYSVNVSLEHQYVFVETPKVACSTIKATLQRIELEEPSLSWHDEDDIHCRDFSPLLRPSQVCCFDKLVQSDRFFVFCFVRHPYSRLLSAYLDKLVRGKREKRRVLRRIGQRPAAPTADLTFTDFVAFVCSQEPADMDPHWRPQVYQTCYHAIPYDFIGRFERFDDDFRHVLGRLNNNFTPYWYDARQHATQTSLLLERHYTPQTKNQVYETFQNDFDAFGYSK